MRLKLYKYDMMTFRNVIQEDTEYHFPRYCFFTVLIKRRKSLLKQMSRNKSNNNNSKIKSRVITFHKVERMKYVILIARN